MLGADEGRKSKKDMKKVLAIILTATFMFTLAACGGGETGETGSGTEETAEEAGETQEADTAEGELDPENFFLWNENIIIGLSESGAQQTSLVIPERCEGFAGGVFSSVENSVEEVSFASSKNVNLGSAFAQTDHLKKVTLPAELTRIGDMDFWGCRALESIVIPEKVVSLGELSFGMCTSLKKVEMSGSVIRIGKRAFDGCSALEELVLSDSIESIGNLAFNQVKTLKTFTFPKSLKTVGSLILSGEALTDIYVPEEVVLEQVKEDSFAGLGPQTVHVKKDSFMDKEFEKYFMSATKKKAE